MFDDWEATARLGSFLGIFISMAVLERLFPRRPAHPLRPRRWVTNLLMVVIDSAVLRVLFPLAGVGFALWAAARDVGLLHHIALPGWLAVLISFVLLDLAIWLWHLASHKLPLLWRLHKVHHADRDLDVTSALRFHPLEIIASMLWKAAVIMALGAPPLAVLLFEIVLNGGAMFNHANLNLPPWLDRSLRLVIVTPDMHRVHHSVHPHETDSNYGFNLSLWDRLFRTYVPQPQDGHDTMIIGLKAYQTEAPARLGWSLLLPFRRPR